MKHECKGDAGEEYVNELTYKSYLKYWCYPNPKDIKGLNPLVINMADTLAPKVKLPSADRSENLSILYVIYIKK